MAAPDYATKVGNTFYAEGVYADAAGNPVNLDSARITITSAMVSPDGSRTVDLTVTPLDQAVSPGRYTLRTETADFVPGLWRWDLRFHDATDGSSDSTTTLRVAFSEQVTA